MKHMYNYLHVDNIGSVLTILALCSDKSYQLCIIHFNDSVSQFSFVDSKAKL